MILSTLKSHFDSQQMSCCWCWWVGGAIGALLATVKLYAKLTCGRYSITQDLSNKVVLITGCTAGIGKETAIALARHGAKVYMACRNLQLAEAVKREIESTTGNRRIVVIELDLNKLASVRQCAKEFLATGDPLHILINNAGLAGNSKLVLTEDGLEETMASNHFGHFLLTNLLLEKLKSSAPARIVVVSSMAYKFAKLDPTDMNYTKRPWPGATKAYHDSKMANILMTRELNKQLHGTRVTCNSLNPGAVHTDIYRKVPLWVQPFLQFALIFCKTAKEGSEANLHCALDPRLEHVSGQYFSDNSPATLILTALDDSLAEAVWAESAKLVGLEAY